MANSNGWGDGAANNAIGWGQGANNAIGWGDIHADSWAGLTDIVGITTDPDAQAFITAAAITDPTQQSAINQLVVDLKGYSIWTKMKALYPFVGGTAAQHKWNLKDPRDLDAAFRLVFNGGWTHSANGALPNGTNAYADTKFKVETNTTQFNNSYGIYSRTNNVSGTFLWGMWDGGANFHLHYVNNYQFYSKDKAITYSAQPTTKLMLATRRSQTDFQAYRDGVSLGTNTTSAWTFGSDFNMYLSARNAAGTAQAFMPHELAFAFFADSLTNSEAINLTTAVNTFQTTLGRSIGTQTVSDADAQAFVTNAGIVDQVEANAINNLVIGLKADGLWTKMKAVYPFVGGTSSTHKWNLKDPRDLDAAFRLVFSGGWTHSSTGATPNGTNGYADTKFVPSTHLGVNSNSLGYYSGTNLSETMSDPTNIGAFISVTQGLVLAKTNTLFAGRLNGSAITYSTTTMIGFFSASRQSSTLTDIYLNGSQVGTGNSGGTLPNNNVLLGNISIDPSSNPYGSGYVKNDFRFAYLSDGLSDTEAANLNTRVTTFQTALNRNV